MDRKLYKDFEQVQNYHWWFQGRKQIITYFIEACMKKQGNILDIGCGTGAMLPTLSHYGQVYGTDFEEEAVSHCNRQWDFEVKKGSLPDHIPFTPGTFDLVTCLDVVEHIDRDVEALQKIYDMVKPGGIAIITVPAFSFLWGYNDVLSHHKRRYTKPELLQKLDKTGFITIRCSYFNTLLFPAAFVVRKIKNLLKIERADLMENSKNGLVNKMLAKIFICERYLLGRFQLPFGVSIIAVLQKELDKG